MVPTEPPPERPASMAAEVVIRYGDLLILHDHLREADEVEAAALVHRACIELENAHKRLHQDGAMMLEAWQAEPMT